MQGSHHSSAVLYAENPINGSIRVDMIGNAPTTSWGTVLTIQITLPNGSIESATVKSGCFDLRYRKSASDPDVTKSFNVVRNNIIK